MQETWLEQFYNEMDAEKRLDILNTNADKTVNASEMANHSADKDSLRRPDNSFPALFSYPEYPKERSSHDSG